MELCVQVEGIVGTFVANVKSPGSRFGSKVISYDKGGEWVPLRPPQFDRRGGFINCQQVGVVKGVWCGVVNVYCLAFMFVAPAHPKQSCQWIPVHPDSRLSHRAGHGPGQPGSYSHQFCFTGVCMCMHVSKFLSFNWSHNL